MHWHLNATPKKDLEMSAVGGVITRSSLVLGGFGGCLRGNATVCVEFTVRSNYVIGSASSCK